MKEPERGNKKQETHTHTHKIHFNYVMSLSFRPKNPEGTDVPAPQLIQVL